MQRVPLPTERFCQLVKKAPALQDYDFKAWFNTCKYSFNLDSVVKQLISEHSNPWPQKITDQQYELLIDGIVANLQLIREVISELYEKICNLGQYGEDDSDEDAQKMTIVYCLSSLRICYGISAGTLDYTDTETIERIVLKGMRSYMHGLVNARIEVILFQHHTAGALSWWAVVIPMMTLYFDNSIYSAILADAL